MSDEQQSQEQQEKVNGLIKNYKLTFETESGAKVLEDLQRRCHMFTTTNVKSDSHESAFNEGQRAVMLFVMSMLKRNI
tara:strand:- start:946 stop:1179 length:234 start_codon:yes stop_codon:yes gene_type:complete